MVLIGSLLYGLGFFHLLIEINGGNVHIQIALTDGELWAWHG